MQAAREGRAAASFAALATSHAFVHALTRDVHILTHSFALTWTWLEGQVAQPPSPPIPLRWAYGALLVFERVWVRNQWHQLRTVLAAEPDTQRAFYEATTRALLDTLAPADASDAQLLHAIGGVLGVYLLWAHRAPHTPPVGIDLATLERLRTLPERARTVLDTPPPAASAPPSADVWYAVRALLDPPSQGPVIVPQVPAPPCLVAHTALVPRGERRTRAQAVGSVGAYAPPAPTTPPHTAPADDAVHAIAASLGIPGADDTGGASRHTAASVRALAAAQVAYTDARAGVSRHAPEAPPGSDASDDTALARLAAYLA
ncbi:hypothetical protein MBRA1_002328 [Malassezia brasiliensis]|uniref:Uncharacterized protein n=1 Tax=Malassezia brasiliensis TaxID=1821822 RepID=A0AAF0DT26_9BASI|nr:hypothetical protein MBRA1_002328 [Malassezia brasiliensis]